MGGNESKSGCKSRTNRTSSAYILSGLISDLISHRTTRVSTRAALGREMTPSLLSSTWAAMILSKTSKKSEPNVTNVNALSKRGKRITEGAKNQHTNKK